MSIIIHNTESELHDLLDDLVDGQIITARWDDGRGRTITATGPALVDCDRVSCNLLLRMYDRTTNPDLISVEVTTEQTVTVTRDDPVALRALIESLTEGQTVTTEWRRGDRSMVINAPVSCGTNGRVRVPDPWGIRFFGIAADAVPHPSLHSVTVTREVTTRALGAAAANWGDPTWRWPL